MQKSNVKSRPSANHLWLKLLCSLSICCSAFLAIQLIVLFVKNGAQVLQESTLIIGNIFALAIAIALAFVTKSYHEKIKDEEDVLKSVSALFANSTNEHLSKCDDTTVLLKTLAVELDAALRREKSIVDRAVDVICVIDIDGRFASVSRACKSAWGYESQDIVGKPLADFIVSGNTDNILAAIVGASKSIDKVVFDCQFKKASGELAYVVFTGHWSATESGFYCIVHDITERKQLEAMKREFMAMISHDVKTPLSSIMGLIGLLESGQLGELTEEGKRLSKRVRNECARVAGLISDMLDIERIESGKFSLDRCHIRLGVIAQNACDVLTSAAAEKQIKLNVVTNEFVCFADEQRIMQVMINLLSNAIKFSPTGSIVEIDIVELDKNLEVRIIDHGNGIPEDKLKTIFDRFQRVQDKGISQADGHGLGLAICKSIVIEHGGEIGVRSKLGEGSTFWFTLPKDDGNSAASAQLP